MKKKHYDKFMREQNKNLQKQMKNKLTQGTMELQMNTDEKWIIEHSLNLAHSGEKGKATFFLSLMALFNQWNKDKLFYYFKEAGIEN